jgi:hypothetical protein
LVNQHLDNLVNLPHLDQQHQQEHSVPHLKPQHSDRHQPQTRHLDLRPPQLQVQGLVNLRSASRQNQHRIQLSDLHPHRLRIPLHSLHQLLVHLADSDRMPLHLHSVLRLLPPDPTRPHLPQKQHSVSVLAQHQHQALKLEEHPDHHQHSVNQQVSDQAAQLLLPDSVQALQDLVDLDLRLV